MIDVRVRWQRRASKQVDIVRVPCQMIDDDIRIVP